MTSLQSKFLHVFTVGTILSEKQMACCSNAQCGVWECCTFSCEQETPWTLHRVTAPNKGLPRVLQSQGAGTAAGPRGCGDASLSLGEMSGEAGGRGLEASVPPGSPSVQAGVRVPQGQLPRASSFLPTQGVPPTPAPGNSCQGLSGAATKFIILQPGGHQMSVVSRWLMSLIESPVSSQAQLAGLLALGCRVQFAFLAPLTSGRFKDLWSLSQTGPPAGGMCGLQNQRSCQVIPLFKEKTGIQHSGQKWKSQPVCGGTLECSLGFGGAFPMSVAASCWVPGNVDSTTTKGHQPPDNHENVTRQPRRSFWVLFSWFPFNSDNFWSGALVQRL